MSDLIKFCGDGVIECRQGERTTTLAVRDGQCVVVNPQRFDSLDWDRERVQAEIVGESEPETYSDRL